MLGEVQYAQLEFGVFLLLLLFRIILSMACFFPWSIHSDMLNPHIAQPSISKATTGQGRHVIYLMLVLHFVSEMLGVMGLPYETGLLCL